HLHVVGNCLVIESSRLVLPPANCVFSRRLKEGRSGEHLLSGYITVFVDVHLNGHVTLNAVLLCNCRILWWYRGDQAWCLDVRNGSRSRHRRRRLNNSAQHCWWLRVRNQRGITTRNSRFRRRLITRGCLFVRDRSCAAVLHDRQLLLLFRTLCWLC